jgi:hypothetical protein
LFASSASTSIRMVRRGPRAASFVSSSAGTNHCGPIRPR